MSSDADSPRQRTVAELLAAHGGDTAVTGRRARRRAAEDAADGAPAVVEAPPVSPAPQPPATENPANGSAVNGNYSNGAPAPYRNAGPAPSANGASYGAPVGDPFINGGADPTGESYAAHTPDGPYANGAGQYVNGGPVRGGDGPGAPYVNGNVNGDTTYGGPRPGAPYANGSTDTTYSGPPTRAGDVPGARPDAGPYGNGNGNGNGSPRGGRGASDPRTAAPWTPDRSVLREPVPRDIDGPTDGRAEPWSPPSAEQARARPTEEMPRLRSDRTPMLDPGMTGPIDMQRLPQADDLDEGPSTAVGMAPVGAEDWHRERTGRRRAGRDDAPAADASDPFESFADPPAGLDDEPGRRRSSPDVGKSAGQAWAAVVAQWIAGAIGGAALWVGFRFLWRDLPVVALAAAALVTVGLVLVVRALMHNDDRRTTLFAVLVGLLLTVSPALLVLLGR
jgi:hypothetical protein